MYTRKVFNTITRMMLMLFINASCALAQSTSGGIQDVGTATDNFSTTILAIFKGPLVKIVACVVLFAGVAGLLRGKHQVAVSCGVAFILLLCLPVILGYFGAH